MIKEIKSKLGKIHFRRYSLLSTKWFSIYIHHILSSDEDRDPHDHPFSFQSLILKGSYMERAWYAPNFMAMHTATYLPGDVIKHQAKDAHKITLLTKEVWTLVLVSGREREWGYRLKDGSWLDHQTYRQLKNNGTLP